MRLPLTQLDFRLLGQHVSDGDIVHALDIMFPVSWSLLKSEHTALYWIGGRATPKGEKLQAEGKTAREALRKIHADWYGWVHT